jgi:hypothetical protein
MSQAEIITKAKAKDRGLKRYFTGRKCPRGHCAERLVSTGTCIECQKIFLKAYRKKHPEKTRAKRRAYREAHPDRVKRKNDIYYAKNAEKCREARRKYAAKVSDMIIVLREEMPDLLKEFGL